MTGTAEGLGDFLKGVADKIREKMTQYEDRGISAAMFAMKGEMIDRTFEQGLDSNGSKIGSYSRKEGYYTQDQFKARPSAFKPQGKTGESTFFKGKKAGQPHQSMYLREGYGQLREIQGRQAAFVDAKMSGSLMLSINVYRQNGNEWVIAIPDEKESIKRKAIEKRFGKAIFPPADSDVQVFREAMDAEVEAIKEEL